MCNEQKNREREINSEKFYQSINFRKDVFLFEKKKQRRNGVRWENTSAHAKNGYIAPKKLFFPTAADSAIFIRNLSLNIINTK